MLDRLYGYKRTFSIAIKTDQTQASKWGTYIRALCSEVGHGIEMKMNMEMEMKMEMLKLKSKFEFMHSTLAAFVQYLSIFMGLNQESQKKNETRQKYGNFITRGCRRYVSQWITA